MRQRQPQRQGREGEGARGPDGSFGGAPKASLARRAGLIALVFGLLGVPTLVIVAMFSVDLPLEATEGAHPGGVVAGRIVDASGNALGGVAVSGSTLVRGQGGREVVRATSDAEGRYALELPPHQGRYVIEAGDEEWVSQRHEFSFLDKRGRTIEPPSLAFELEPACILELEFDARRGEPRARVSGDWAIAGELHRAVLALISARYERSGRFDDGVLRIGGLPPMRAKLHLEFDDARSITLDLDLSAGLRRERLEL